MTNQQLPTNLSGITKKHKGNGRKLGYPTANLNTDTKLKDGIYFGYATLGSYHHQPAIIFIGTPVTVGDTERRVEAHLLDIKDVDYYGLKLDTDIQYFHRPNKTLNNVTELIEMMHHDEAEARRWFIKHNLKT